MRLNPIEWFSKRGSDRALGDSPYDQALIALFAGTQGAAVTRDTALASVAVLACLQVRAETFASLPGGVYKKETDRRLAQPEHPIARLLFERPNELMTSAEFWRWKSLRQDSDGNAHARIARTATGYDMLPLYKQRPEPILDKGRLVYRYAGDELTPANDYPAEQILHWKGPILKSPFEGASLIALTKDTIGLSIDAERFFTRFLGNGNHFPLYLQTEQELKPGDIQALREQMKGSSGVLAAGETRVFDRGLKVMNNAMSLKDADLTAQQRWNLEQVCRIFRVPLPLVQDWTHGTYTNNEQGGLWFAQHTITPMCIDTERVCQKLFVNDRGMYVKFNVDGLLRGDFGTRMSGYATAVASGFMTRAQCRALEEWEPLTGLEKPLVPLNMGQIDANGNIEPTTPATGAPSVTPPSPTRSILQPLIDDALDCIRTRAEQDRARGRDTADTIGFATRKLAPVAEACRIAAVDVDLDAMMKEALA